MKIKPSPKKAEKVVKGLSISPDLLRRALNQAQLESRSFSFIVSRSIERDLARAKDEPLPPLPSTHSELMDIKEVAARLKLSVRSVRRRLKTPGHPLRKARSRIGKLCPIQFVRSAVEQIEREQRALGA